MCLSSWLAGIEDEAVLKAEMEEQKRKSAPGDLPVETLGEEKNDEN